MEPNRKSSRIALAIVMTGVLTGATVTTAVLVDRSAGNTELAVAPVGAAAPALDDDGVDPDDSDDTGDTGAETEASQPGSDAAADTVEAEPVEADSPPPAMADSAVTDFATDSFIECAADGDYYEPSAEEIAESRAEAEAQAAVLAAAGISHTLESDPQGWSWVDWDYDDAIAQSVVNSFYRDLYGDEIYEITPEELDRMREENAALAAAFDEAGIAYELIVDGDWEWIEWDYQAVVDAYWEALFGVDGEYGFGPEIADLERMQDENAGLMAAFDAAGIAYELIVEPDGWEWVEYDWENRDAQAVADRYWGVLYWDEMSDEERERVRTENAGLMAALDDAGIDYDLLSDESGWEQVSFDWNDPETQMVVDEYYATLYGDCYYAEGDWTPSQQDIDASVAEADALGAAFDAAGIAYTVESDGNGIVWVEWDWEDPAAQAVAEGYWDTLNEARIAEVSAQLDVLEAAFADAGVDFEREGHDECETIIFDTNDADALAVVAGLSNG